ncbi:hypothetical protein DH2020_033612 [Rehmannia glutinosa]|uniref:SPOROCYTELESS-like EAR-containing protein n=1 Tax=Rehmannia glutinosa TaxID=99300 RepID=A0ABR0VE37_REHGL
MAQEEHILGCSYSGGGGNGGGGGENSFRSKKIKQKKVPQRGLGVAQLEKIRLEEQQKKEGKNAISDNTTPFLLCPNFRPSICPSVEIRHENSVQMSKKLNAGGGEVVVSETILSPLTRNWPKSWNGEYNLGGEDMSHNLIAFEPQLNLKTSILPQKSHQFQRHSSCSSLLQVKSSSGISSSVLNSQMEPPSNQNFHCNNYTLTEENKMVGMKRSYPFSLEKGVSISNPPEKYTNEVTSENRRSIGDFLTLAPPEVASPPLNLKHKHLLDYSDHQLSKEYGKSQIHEAGPSGLVVESFSFFPIKIQTNQRTTHVSNGNGENGETIDLNLKL